MSLARFAIRLCAARALRGATLAEDRVFDSAIEPLDQQAKAGRQPFLVVFTGDHRLTIEGRDLTGGEGEVELVLEAAIASRVELPGTDGTTQVSIVVPNTDEGMEITLDMLEYQAIAAISTGRNVWADLWRRLVLRIVERHSRRGASSDEGVRFAARQISLMCETVADPIPGQPVDPGTVWGDFLAAMDADPVLAPIGKIVRYQIEVTRPDWQVAADMLGISDTTADQIALVPLVDPAPTITELDVVTDTGTDTLPLSTM